MHVILRRANPFNHLIGFLNICIPMFWILIRFDDENYLSVSQDVTENTTKMSIKL